jgi:hypothetical protein
VNNELVVLTEAAEKLAVAINTQERGFAELTQLQQQACDLQRQTTAQARGEITQLVQESVRQMTRSFQEGMASILAHAHRKLLMGYAAFAGAMVLFACGGGLLLWQERQAYDDARAKAAEAQVSAELVQAYTKVGVTSCGGQPCLKLDTKTRRWGNKGEYVLIDVAPPKSRQGAAEQ